MRKPSSFIRAMILSLICLLGADTAWAGRVLAEAADSPATRSSAIEQRRLALHLFGQLEGSWEGSGHSQGPISDQVVWQWTLDRRFLRMTYAAQSGDRFRAEGYLWWNDSLGQVEFYEFNNGDWPVRALRGKVSSDGRELRLEEHEHQRSIRLTIRVTADGHWQFEEANLLGNGSSTKPFAAVQFARAARR